VGGATRPRRRERRLGLALRELERVSIDPSAREELEGLARFIVEREF
jgi:hypothetical protein